MTSIIKQHKVLGALPLIPDPNAIYYVKIGSGFNIFVTDDVTGIPRSLNQELDGTDFLDLRNEETFGVPKGTVVYNTGTGYKVASAKFITCKKVIGLTVFDTLPGAVGLVQTAGPMVFNTVEWAVLTNNFGGVSNANYWLDSVAQGSLSLLSPTEAQSPVWSLKMGYGLNSSTFYIEIKQSIKL